MKKSYALGLLMALVVFSSASHAIGIKSVKWQLNSAMIWQNLSQYDQTGSMYKLQPGFQATQANLRMDTAVNDGIDVMAEWYLSSRPHIAQLYDSQGYVMIKQFPKDSTFGFMNGALNLFSIKAGHFEVDYGMNGEYSTNNAERRKNPLVGNFLVNPLSVESGMEISSKPGNFFWTLGIGSGITSELFDVNRGTSKHAKVGVDTGAFKVSWSGYFCDNSGVGSYAGSTKPTSELYLSNRIGSRYTAIVNGLTGTWNGNPVLGNGGNVNATQFDLSTKLGAIEFYGNTGWMYDGDYNALGAANGVNPEEWVYYGAQLVYRLNKDIYFAYRYGQADTNKLSANNTTYISLGGPVSISRTQAGFGIFMMPDLLWRVEYVEQGYHNMNLVNTTAPTGTWTNPNYSGFVTDVTMPLDF